MEAVIRRIGVIDTTLRDGQQSLWATRMTTAMMLPVAERLDEAGYDAIEIMGSVHFDAAVRYLKEDPWERIRLMSARIPNTPLKSNIRSKSLVTFRLLPDDVVHLWVERLIANGVQRITPFDPLFDLDNIVDTIKVAKRAGAAAGVAFIYCDSPVHTDAFYVGKVRELMDRVEVDHIMLKDSGGLLTPDRIRTLVPALKGIMGDMSLELHSHCMTGLAPLVYLEGIAAGADTVQTGTPPLANGSAQPSTPTVVRNLRQMGYQVDVDLDAVDDVSRHFFRVAELEGKPIGTPREYDAFHYTHQIPGGALTNIEMQLKEAGLIDRFDAVLEECARVREELGWIILVSPFAQFVVMQALHNVLSDERYSIVPDEVKMYALGHFGRLVAPVAPEVLDRIVENGSKDIALEPRPLEPVVPGLRRKYPACSDEERLLRFMFRGSQVDGMLAAGPTRTDYDADRSPHDGLVREILKLQRIRQATVRCGDWSFELDRDATATVGGES